jgi:hypothetical protein
VHHGQGVEYASLQAGKLIGCMWRLCNTGSPCWEAMSDGHHGAPTYHWHTPLQRVLCVPSRAFAFMCALHSLVALDGCDEGVHAPPSFLMTGSPALLHLGSVQPVAVRSNKQLGLVQPLLAKDVIHKGVRRQVRAAVPAW